MKTPLTCSMEPIAPALGIMGSERGVALLLVLWVGTFFGIVLSSFAFSMRTELVAAKNFKDREVASSLARAGVSRAFVEMVNGKSGDEPTASTSRLYNSGHVPLGRGTYDVVLTDEESKISLNRATPAVLRTLLRNNGVTDPHLLDGVVDSILDWRDADDLHHLNGAEADYYGGLAVPYRPRNGSFEAVEELLLVKGMTRGILYGNIEDPERSASLREQAPGNRVFGDGEYLGVYSFLTVYGTGSVNRDRASLDVLTAVGLSDDAARAIISGRARGLRVGQQAPSTPGTSRGVAGRIYRIESVGRVDKSPARYRIVVTVLSEGNPRAPRFKVIDWHEGLG